MKDFVRKLRWREKIKSIHNSKGFQVYYVLEVKVWIFWIPIRRVLGSNRDELIKLMKHLNTYF